MNFVIILDLDHAMEPHQLSEGYLRANVRLLEEKRIGQTKLQGNPRIPASKKHQLQIERRMTSRGNVSLNGTDPFPEQTR